MHALIDGDVVVYSMGFAADKTYYTWGKKKFLKHATAKKWMKHYNHNLDELIRHHEPASLNDVIDKIDSFIAYIIEEVEANGASLFLTGGGNFRELIDHSYPYKGNRDRAKRPTWYKEIRDYLISEYSAILVEGQEADDALGITQTQLINSGLDSVICSIDKDLLMIPGNHYNWNTRKITYVDEYQGWYNFYKQMLTGDKVDNIIGIDGVGPVTADAILRPHLDPQGLMCAVGNEYAKHFDDPEYRMLENASLLYIRKYPEETWHFKKHEDIDDE